MQLKKLKPTTPGQRHQIVLCKNLLSKNNSFLKVLIDDFCRKKGRCRNTGRITVRHKGGGCKKAYRKINFGNFWGKSIVLANFYDPWRSSFLSLTFDLINKKFDFILATEFVYPGSFIVSNFEHRFLDLKLGYRTWIKNIAPGSFIYNVSLKPSKRAQYIRSAGTRGQIVQKTVNDFKIRLPSGKVLVVSDTAVGTVGICSNLKHKLTVVGKAGRNRLMGKRPSVRGIAMNPVDHPHGGKGNGGRPGGVTPWAKPTRGKPTAKKKK
jgi:large subunit ribosomal protein L2